MAKRVTRTRPARQGGSRGSTVAPTRREPVPQQPQAERRPPFLKAEHIGSRAMLKFVPGSVRTVQAPWGHQLIVDVTLRGGGTFSWGIGTNKPNLRLVVEHLISNPGKPMEVISMQGDRGRFIAVPQPDEPARIDDDSDVEDEDVPF